MEERIAKYRSKLIERQQERAAQPFNNPNARYAPAVKGVFS